MRWCFFSPGYRSIQVLAGDTRNSGGAEAQMSYLAAAMARLGHEVALIYGEGRRAQRQVIDGVTCIDAAPSWRRPASLAAFWEALNSFSPDVLYATLPSDFLWIMGLFARRHRGARFVYWLAHDSHCSPWGSYEYKRWFHEPLYALGLQSADVIAVQHDRQRELVSRSLRDRLARVPNLMRSFSDLPRDFDATTFDAIWIALIRPQKQLEHFLDLAASLPDLRFAVVGKFDDLTMSADQRASLEARLVNLKNVAFLGPQRSEKVMALLAQSKVLVNTSCSEGFPITMLEAWSVGVPVVSLSFDPGVIEREQIGLVSETKARLLRDVSKLTGSESLNRQFGGRGLDYVRRRHSLEAFCGALAQALPGSRILEACY